MTYLIVMALLLTFVQIGVLPLMFNLSNVGYLLGNRDEANPESILVSRAKRAGKSAKLSRVSHFVYCPDSRQL